jgi:hypothetical protein
VHPQEFLDVPKKMLFQLSRPTNAGKPAFLFPPPWFWLIVESYNLALFAAFESPISIYSLNIFIYLKNKGAKSNVQTV